MRCDVIPWWPIEAFEREKGLYCIPLFGIFGSFHLLLQLQTILIFFPLGSALWVTVTCKTKSKIQSIIYTLFIQLCAVMLLSFMWSTRNLLKALYQKSTLIAKRPITTYKLSGAYTAAVKKNQSEVLTFLWHQHSATGQWTLARLHQSAWNASWIRCEWIRICTTWSS